MSFSDPADPNYFRLSSIAEIRSELATLRDWIEFPGDITTQQVEGAIRSLIALAWPAMQPGFDAAFEADRAFVRRLEGQEP